ncbi:MAG: hypothetical protein AUK47_25455 [Deltaproteobacteria bacterium CG2_30_63_29]|nr:MAG: hypothetical protein AUK47_25455 [Deltaproteobacteria bacterium CG2_30_63_29]PIW01099.1 MAG: hypothetical protein COW42_05925 [Deltaproteobacteria bacterium CG17_big_fil_post_rev_8_21_14_2_50_63_7]PJB42367.1 MAG: hypothetical protein CO108_11730 [Deltaproteobacteria bacterium CG_4_9_14_3_um_filter_63_12]
MATAKSAVCSNATSVVTRKGILPEKASFMKSKILFASLVLLAGSVFTSSAFAGDVPPCTALKAGLCEVCGAEVCAKILDADVEDAECLEIIDELAKAEESIKDLSEEDKDTFYIELCTEIGSEDEGDAH